MSRITIYATHTCPYCHAALRLLVEKGFAHIEKIWVDDVPHLRQEMRERSGRTSVPQIFFDEHHIGGFDDLAALNARGELTKILQSQMK